MRLSDPLSAKRKAYILLRKRFILALEVLNKTIKASASDTFEHQPTACQYLTYAQSHITGVCHFLFSFGTFNMFVFEQTKKKKLSDLRMQFPKETQPNANKNRSLVG